MTGENANEAIYNITITFAVRGSASASRPALMPVRGLFLKIPRPVKTPPDGRLSRTNEKPGESAYYVGNMRGMLSTVMNKLFLLVQLSILFAFACEPVDNQGSASAIRKGATVVGSGEHQILAEPSILSDSLSSVFPTEEVFFLKQREVGGQTWAQIEYQGTVGWIEKKHLKIGDTAQARYQEMVSSIATKGISFSLCPVEGQCSELKLLPLVGKTGSVANGKNSLNVYLNEVSDQKIRRFHIRSWEFAANPPEVKLMGGLDVNGSDGSGQTIGYILFKGGETWPGEPYFSWSPNGL